METKETKETTGADWTRQAIVVRKRTAAETSDLAFLVIGKEFKNLAFYFAVLAVPVFLLDVVFFAAFAFGSPSDVAASEKLLLQNCFVYLVVAWQTAFVGSLATRYLGVWLFESEREIERREIWASWRDRLPQLLYFLALTRPFRFAPFYAETILLERTTFRKTPGRRSTVERVRSLNRGFFGFGELSVWLPTAAVSGYFLLDALGPTFVATGKIWSAAFHWAIFPAFLFGLRFYVVVWNFLRYINLRVATEGWDVDLAFRGERAKLTVDERGASSGGAAGGVLSLASILDDAEKRNEI